MDLYATTEGYQRKTKYDQCSKIHNGVPEDAT